MLKSLAIVVFSVLMLSACNTIDGAGQDIENAGEKISEEANKH